MYEETTEVLKVLQKVFGEVELPLCIALFSNDGLVVYETNLCSNVDIESTSVYAMLAYEQLKESLMRKEIDVSALIFRTSDTEYYISPVSDNIFICAISEPGKLSNLITFLDGITRQATYNLRLAAGRKD